ncbi:MAG: hypothetical protein HZA48_06980 [Planctomycetes bacterium]|nr:hypothetical protein [Planctomycetota bacterium]
MAYIIGIDEAGYGPKMGPLVMASVAFSAPDGKTDLWKSLGTVITKNCKNSDHGMKMPVCDSKKVFSPRKGTAQLEKTIHPLLLLLKAQKNIPHSGGFTLPEYLDLLDAGPHENFADYPWYAGIDRETAAGAGNGLKNFMQAVESALDCKGIKFLGAHLEIADAIKFNRSLSGQNKSDFLFELFVNLARKTLNSMPAPAGNTGHGITVYAGKHGGKNFYKNDFQNRFGTEKISIITESRAKSSYKVVAQPHAFTAHFLKDGEDAQFTIALASMFAKYTRELFMRAINRFWLNRVPGLKPTSGYPMDAKRFYNDISGVFLNMSIPRETLWRIK